MAADRDPAGPSIRYARLDDGDAVFGLLAQLGERYTPDRPVFDEAFAEAIKQADDHILYVAEHNGVVVGYALATIARLFYTNGDSAQLQELVVEENARGAGIGTQLVTAIETECQARGVRQIGRAVQQAVIGGAAIYERLDYRSTADFLKKIFDE